MYRGGIRWRWSPLNSARMPLLAVFALLVLPPPSARALDADRQAELAALVRQDCGSCHGLTLKGGLGKPIDPQALAGVDAAGISQIILDGVPGTPMPPWRGLLTVEEATWIAQALKSGLPE